MILRCSTSRPDLERCAGFTLIEVIVTLAILGLALVIVAGYKPPWSSGLGLKGTASELASGLRQRGSHIAVEHISELLVRAFL